MPHPPDPGSRRITRTASRSYLLLLLLLTACPAPAPDPGPQPLADFSERVTALVTTTTRSHLREQPARQTALRTRLPALREAATVAALTAQLRQSPELEEMATVIESDIDFELTKPEHAQIRDRYDSVEVQRQVGQAVIQGMERPLTQLQGG